MDLASFGVGFFLGAGLLLVGGGVLWFLTQRRAPRQRSEPDLQGHLQELKGLLHAVTETQLRGQNEVSEHLRAQERHLQETLVTRLTQMDSQIFNKLQQGQTAQGELLTDLRQRLSVIDHAQKNLKELSGNMLSLQNILGNHQLRGAFGEVMLENQLRDSLPASIVEFQRRLSSGAVVDCLIRLPDPPGSLAIDAKFPMASLDRIRARDAQNEASKAVWNQQIKQLESALKKHIEDIASKYILPGETSEYALMYIPSEGVFADIMTYVPQIQEVSRRKNVLLVSPVTLMAVVANIQILLRDVAVQKQARTLGKEAKGLMEEVERFHERLEKLESSSQRLVQLVHNVRITSDKIEKRAENMLKASDDVALDVKTSPGGTPSGAGDGHKTTTPTPPPPLSRPRDDTT